MDYKGKRVFVLDGYGRMLPTILKQLHDLGCIITTLNDSKLDIGYSSRYPTKKILAKGIREDFDLLRRIIVREIESGNYDVFFPMIENSTDILTQLQEEGKLGNAKLIAAPRNAFLKAFDKELTMNTCMDYSIPCPLTKRDSESLDEFLSKAKFPLACKPRKGTGSTGFKKVENREQLDNYIKDGSICVNEYVIQEFIPHTDYHYGIYMMFDNDGNYVYSVTVKSCRQYPVDSGPGCYIYTVNDEEIKKNSIQLMKALGWKGFGHVGLIMDPRDNTAKVMEINGRIASGIGICNLVGISSVKLLLDYAYGQPISFKEQPYPEKIALRHSQADIMWLIKAKNRFSAKPSWFNFKNNHDYVFSWRDPLPWFTYSMEHVLTYRKDMKKRTH